MQKLLIYKIIINQCQMECKKMNNLNSKICKNKLHSKRLISYTAPQFLTNIGAQRKNNKKLDGNFSKSLIIMSKKRLVPIINTRRTYHFKY